MLGCGLQMHLHVAQVYRSLLASVAYAFHSDNKRTFELDCGTLSAGATRLNKCSYDPKSSGGDNVKVRARLLLSVLQLHTQPVLHALHVIYLHTHLSMVGALFAH